MNVWKHLTSDKLFMVCFVFLCFVLLTGLFASFAAPHDPYGIDIKAKLEGPSIEYPLGTDRLGRCVLSRIVFGIRSTVFMSIVAMCVTIAIGTGLGILSGFIRGNFDEAIMRLCDVMMSFPSELMLLAIVGMMGPGLENIIIANIITKWPWYTRMIRGLALQYRNKNYVLFAKVSGCGLPHIIRRHLLPGIAGELSVLATLDTGTVILTISTLSFLGLGAQPPAAEWGVMLNEAKSVLTTHPAQMLVPGTAIMLLVMAFNFIGDSLQDAMNPKCNTERSRK